MDKFMIRNIINRLEAIAEELDAINFIVPAAHVSTAIDWLKSQQEEMDRHTNDDDSANPL